MRYFQENTSDEKTYIENMSDDDRDIDIESDVSLKPIQIHRKIVFICVCRMEMIRTHDLKIGAQIMEHNIFLRYNFSQFCIMSGCC